MTKFPFLKTFSDNALDSKRRLLEYRDKVLKEVRLMLESRSDMKHFPAWEKFFQDLSGNMNVQNIQHIPLLHEIVSTLGGLVS